MGDVILTVILVAAAMVTASGATVLYLSRVGTPGRHRKVPTPPLRPLKVSVPTFGGPQRQIYRRAEYGDEPVRCTGPSCGHRELAEGEEFVEIPLPDQGPGAMLAVCMPCQGNAVNTTSTPKES